MALQPLRSARAARERAGVPCVRCPGETETGRRDPAGSNRNGGPVMCDSCGCGDTNLVPIEVQQRILSVNERTAMHNRHHFLERSLLTINVMGSPGAGKTAVLEATARALDGQRLIGALAGDL